MQNQLAKTSAQSIALEHFVLVVSDGVEVRVGALGAGREWFKPWRTIGGEALADSKLPQLQVVVEGVFELRACPDIPISCPNLCSTPKGL